MIFLFKKMENQILMNKIKSTYILRNIFKYITDTNFPLKLFIYSTCFQNKIDIKLMYKEKYIDKIGFDINKFFIYKKKNIKKII